MRYMMALGAAVLAVFGDMPLDWAQSCRVYHASRVGDADYLAEVLGCTLNEPMQGRRSMQCGETFLWIGPSGQTELALGAISNVQVEGRVTEARAVTATVGTLGDGRVGRGVGLHLSCYGNVGTCVGLKTPSVEFSNGWRFEARGETIELLAPDGTLRDVWQ